jgi:glutathione S-transferase
MEDISLYGYWRSSATWRVRLMFGLKDIKYQLQITNLLKGEQKTEDYEKLNPMKVTYQVI